jgi:hypothetical protein
LSDQPQATKNFDSGKGQGGTSKNVLDVLRGISLGLVTSSLAA